MEKQLGLISSRENGMNRKIRDFAKSALYFLQGPDRDKLPYVWAAQSKKS